LIKASNTECSLKHYFVQFSLNIKHTVCSFIFPTAIVVDKVAGEPEPRHDAAPLALVLACCFDLKQFINFPDDI
jgi:hypothetical protein